ncbi:uncharacterized protein LOC134532138 isoform X2 [Bacillus rossius redtenbacheri]|uniref:uncharacterized protein LOC134532138 isoform X2 n=1 Tax=Bacillus rossius redtenbacheri TaxID=93214 RepID=UPI002FDE9263
MNIASGLGQDGGGREGKTSRAGHLGSNFRIYRGRALVDSVGPAFGTAIFNCEGTKERFFFFKNKVFVNGKKVTSNTPLTDVLHCDTVVSFEAEPWGKQYDIRFRGLKVDVMNCRVSTDELLPATPYRGNSATQNHSASSMQVMRNHCARVKHISNEGGVLDHTPEVKFHCSVVCIPEYVEGVKTLPDLIPRCTPVNFDAVVTSSGVTATCLWVGDKQTDFKRGSDPDGYVKGWSGTVESYYSCNRGKVGRFKVQGQQMFALFSRQDVFFPEPSEVALQEYLPVGTMVHFDGKLISSGNTTLVKISRLWCGKRPGVVAAAPSQPSPRDCMDSVSSKCSSSLSMGSSTWDGTDVLTIGRNGKVSRYISEDAGFISCSRFGKESEVLFYRSDTDFSSETDGRTSLSAHLPIGSEVYFTAQMFSPGDVVVETVRLIKRHDSSTSPSVMDEESERATPALAEPLTNQSWPEPANDTGVVDGSSPWESLTGRCGVVKFYNSQSEGVLDCIINNVTIEIVFIKGSVLLEPQLCRKQLSKALPVGTSVYFDAKVIMLNGYFEFVATTMWIKKKPKPESAALDSTVVSNTTTELVLRNRTAKVKCFVSDVEGIVEFLFEHTLKEAFFHKDVVFIPKDYNLSVQDYLTVGRSVFFDGHFEKETSGVITITSLWAEKKTKLVVPSPRVVDVSEEVETEMKPQASDCNGIGGRVSAGTSESFSPGGSDRTATSAPKDSEMLGTMPKSIRGHAATVVSYTSKSTGIVQCTVLKKQMTAMFCRGNLLVPDKLKDWPLEEYLPAGKSVYLDGEVSRGEGGLALSVTRLWVGKKPRQCAEESALSLPAGPATLSQTEVYEAEVASVERMCFTACVSLGDSRVAVLVWNQFFRPSLMCEEPLREGELVNLHVSAGDKVFLRVVRNYGKNKDQYEWCACDAWKDNGEVPDERSSSGCGRDETCREGSIVWLDEVSAIVQYGVDGMGVTFRREVALLFGICLATFDLTKVFSIGDTVSFILANDVEASKAWFDSCTIDGSASVFLQVEKFCRARSIPSEVKRALVQGSTSGWVRGIFLPTVHERGGEWNRVKRSSSGGTEEDGSFFLLTRQQAGSIW